MEWRQSCFSSLQFFWYYFWLDPIYKIEIVEKNVLKHMTLRTGDEDKREATRERATSLGMSYGEEQTKTVDKCEGSTTIRPTHPCKMEFGISGVFSTKSIRPDLSIGCVSMLVVNRAYQGAQPELRPALTSWRKGPEDACTVWVLCM
jgi:hypothetical protein